MPLNTLQLEKNQCVQNVNFWVNVELFSVQAADLWLLKSCFNSSDEFQPGFNSS